MHHLYRSTRPTRLAQGLQWLSLSLLIRGMRTLFMSHTDFGGVSNSMIPPGMKRILPGLQSDKDSPRMFVNVETLNKSIRSYLYQHTFGAYTSAIFIEVSLYPHFGLVPLGTNRWYWGQFQKTRFQQQFEDLDFLRHFGDLIGWPLGMLMDPVRSTSTWCSFPPLEYQCHEILNADGAFWWWSI